MEKRKLKPKKRRGDTFRITISGEMTLERDAVAQLLSEDPTGLTPITVDVIVSRYHARPRNGQRKCRYKKCKNRLSVYNRSGLCHVCQNKGRSG